MNVKLDMHFQSRVSCLVIRDGMRSVCVCVCVCVFVEKEERIVRVGVLRHFL